MIIKKLNESYSEIDADEKTLKMMFDYLRVLRNGAYFDPLVKSGFKSPYDYFSIPKDKKLIVMNGHIALLEQFGAKAEPLVSDYDKNDLLRFLQEIKSKLPFPLYDFQETAFIESLLNVKQIAKMCTGSGKSAVISLMAEFLRQKKKRGLLLVPNINLLIQFKNDIKDYNLLELYNDTHVIGGGSTDRHFRNSLTISTWQSLLNYKHLLDGLDYVIGDEIHRLVSTETSDIIKNTVNCKYKWGFTGTLPDDPTMKMELIGMLGLPKTYITSRELIDRGLATPIKINSIIFNYPETDKRIFKEAGNFSQQLKFIKDHEKRNSFIINLIQKLQGHGNTLAIFQHTEHGKGLFIDTMKQLYPDVEVQNKDITGKYSFEFQEKYGVYFLNGEDDGPTREKTRKILEEHKDATLIANFQILSTGTNIRRLHNLIIASPLKSYTTITQSLGRGMRLHETKSVFNVYDLVDSTNFKNNGGIFYKQYIHRKNTSYNPEQYPINEVHYSL